jgi:hypothetical protein
VHFVAGERSKAAAQGHRLVHRSDHSIDGGLALGGEASAGYGDISATGLPRLVMTTCSPVSTAERTSEKR